MWTGLRLSQFSASDTSMWLHGDSCQEHWQVWGLPSCVVNRWTGLKGCQTWEEILRAIPPELDSSFYASQLRKRSKVAYHKHNQTEARMRRWILHGKQIQLAEYFPLVNIPPRRYSLPQGLLPSLSLPRPPHTQMDPLPPSLSTPPPFLCLIHSHSHSPTPNTLPHPPSLPNPPDS